MSGTAFLLAFTAAWLHAGGNVFLGRRSEPEAAVALMLLIGVIAFAPVAALTWRVDADAIPYIVASAVLELGYFAFLAAAYRAADVGLVYPVARGSAPVLALLGAVVIMGRSTSAGQIAGVVAVTIGILLVCGVGVAQASSDRRGVLLALATAVFIAGYTLVDKEGLEHAAAIPYIELVLIGPALVYGAVVLRTRGSTAMRAEATPRLAFVALLLFGTYILVLLALREAPAASVSAVRETSVVIATVLAALAAHQPLRPARLGGATLVALGVALVALAGS
ncbi:MAG TPA: DMT family transporter [Gaiella sp.]|jgi:drug/metabolite transporter (DMT)-like permease